MMKISYKLTKKITKTEKFKKTLKMYNIIDFETLITPLNILVLVAVKRRGILSVLRLNYSLQKLSL